VLEERGQQAPGRELWDRSAHALSDPRAPGDRGRGMKAHVPAGDFWPSPAPAASRHRAPRPGRADPRHSHLHGTGRSEPPREGGGRRAASGVVVATDPGSRRTWIATRHDHLSTPISTGHLRPDCRAARASCRRTVAFVVPDQDLAFIRDRRSSTSNPSLKDGGEPRRRGPARRVPVGQRFTLVRGIASPDRRHPRRASRGGPARDGGRLGELRDRAARRVRRPDRAS